MSAPAQPLEPFDQAAQKERADLLGMFVFLASEVMLFGGVIAALLVYRLAHPAGAVEAAGHLHVELGVANTAILLTSSLLVALASVAAREGARRAATTVLCVAALLGLAFLAVKASEYRLEYLDGLMPGIGPPSPFHRSDSQLFMSLYFVGTALHAVHVSIGVVLLGGAAAGIRLGRLPLPERKTTVELVGLYWHLVDVIWLFLFPLLYLARP